MRSMQFHRCIIDASYVGQTQVKVAVARRLTQIKKR